MNIKATLVSDKKIEKAEAWLSNGNTYESVELKPLNNYDFSAEVSENLMKEGFLKYRIIVSTEEGKTTFPGRVEGSPENWDFHSAEQYQTKIVEPDSPVYLFNAATDTDNLVRTWKSNNKLVPVNDSEAEFQIKLDKLFDEDIENQNAEPIHDYSLRYNFEKKIGDYEVSKLNDLVINARSLNSDIEKLQVALLMKNGAAFGKILELNSETRDIKISLDELEPVKTVTLPRPYPGFLPYYFEHSYSGDLKLDEIESIQFSIGPGIEKEDLQKPHAVGIRSVRLE